MTHPLATWLPRALLAVTSLGCFALLVHAAHPGRNFLVGPAFSALIFFAALLQVVGTLLALKPPSRQVPRTFLGILASVWLLALAASETLIPLRAALLLSDPWLRPQAHAVLRGSIPRQTPYTSFLFRIHYSFLRDRVAYLSTGTCGLFGDAGFAYAPHGLPASQAPNRVEPTYEHLYGPWFRYSLHDD